MPETSKKSKTIEDTVDAAIAVKGQQAIDCIKVEGSSVNTDVIFEDLKKAVSDRLSDLSGYLATIPKNYAKEKTQPNYQTKSRVITVSTSKRHGEVILDYTPKKKRFLRQTLPATAKLLIKTDAEICVFDYKIPELGNIPEDQLLNLASEVSAAAIVGLQDTEFESALVRAITEITGINVFPQIYFEKKYKELCGKLNEKISDALLKGKIAIDDLAKQTKVDFDSVKKKTLFERVESEIEQHKQNAKKQIDEEVEKFRIKWATYAKKLKTVAQEEVGAELKKANSLKQEYEKKLAELSERMRDKREKVSKDAHKIIPTFEELFPDIALREKYSAKIDHSLRLYYAQRLQKDLSELQEISLDESLKIIKILREKCFEKNERPKGASLRELYAGFAAMLDYVRKHEISAAETIKRLESVKTESSSKSVEQLLECAFVYDFDLNKHKSFLHSDSARKKEDLGLK